jgi:cation diffusion facilitator CzcD-associated flavoprotein CzcO
MSVLFSPYPDTWPAFTSRDKLADWFESYAKSHDLVIWTSSPLLSCPRRVYSEVDKLWTAHIGQLDVSTRTVRCQHIVLATGVLGPPMIPDVPGAECFRGEVLHARKFSSGTDYEGRRVLVVGGANTAANVYQDLANLGAARVTILQRTASCVLLSNTLAREYSAAFPAREDVGLTDFCNASVPHRVRERLILQEREARIARGEDPDVAPGDEE